MAPVPSTNVIPGEGLDTLKLGQSLYSIVSDFNASNEPLKIAYLSKDYLNTPVTVQVPKLGLRLVFENHDRQQLVLLEVTSFAFLRLVYNNTQFSEVLVNEVLDDLTTGPEASNELHFRQEKVVRPPTLSQIYNKTFGPTYPGTLSGNNYVLSYPGISFRFEIHLSELRQKLAVLLDESAILSKLINWDKAADISCTSLAVYNGDNYEHFHRSTFGPKNAQLGAAPVSQDKSSPLLVINLHLGLVKVILSSPEKGNGTGPENEFIITIGSTTQQEILSLLGPPDAYFNKFDLRLLIHKHLKSVADDTAQDSNGLIYKFHNYYRFGIDFMYDLNGHQRGLPRNTGVLKKVVLHNGGITESLDFMRWNKCNWKILAGGNGVAKSPFDEAGPSVDSLMYFSQIPEQFFLAINKGGDSEVRPVLLNRSESEFIDKDLEFIQPEDVAGTDVVFQQSVLSSSSVSTGESALKTWGQSKLYGCERCIWEVLESNGCISCVTIY